MRKGGKGHWAGDRKQTTLWQIPSRDQHADLAQLAARRFILGPIANALSGVFSGAGGIFANVLHAGGMVGSAGRSRMVPAMAFAAAAARPARY